MENKTVVLQFRATGAQAQRLERLAQLTGKNQSEVMRALLDSATVATPVLMSNYAPSPVGDQRMAATNAP